MAGGFSWEVRSSTQGNWSSLLHTDNSEWNLGGKPSPDKGLLEGWLEGEWGPLTGGPHVTCRM